MVTAVDGQPGMIVVPHDIVGAESYDIGANNLSSSGDSLQIGGGRSVIKLPQLVEHETMISGTYSEVNSQNFEIVGVYAMVDHANGKYNSQAHKAAKRLAQKSGLTFVEIDRENGTQTIMQPDKRRSFLNHIVGKGESFVTKSGLFSLDRKIRELLRSKTKHMENSEDHDNG